MSAYSHVGKKSRYGNKRSIDPPHPPYPDGSEIDNTVREQQGLERWQAYQEDLETLRKENADLLLLVQHLKREKEQLEHRLRGLEEWKKCSKKLEKRFRVQ